MHRMMSNMANARESNTNLTTGAARRRIVGVSTKMYFTHARTAAFVSAVLAQLAASPEETARLLSAVDAFIIPDFVSIPTAVAAVRGAASTAASTAASAAAAAAAALGNIKVGAQDCCAAPEDFGAFTGEVSAAVLREVGCGIVEVGHAERRAGAPARSLGKGDGAGSGSGSGSGSAGDEGGGGGWHVMGETDEVVRAKVRAVVRNGMVPLVCVGEVRAPGGDSNRDSSGSRNTTAAGDGGGASGDGDWCGGEETGVREAAEEVLRQVAAALEGLEEEAEVVLAYEPVWAIGAAEPASAEHVRGVVRRVRESEVVRNRKGMTRIVYGGAARPGLWERLGGEVDGLFLGRFAHQPEQFVKILYEVAGIAYKGHS